MSNAAKKMLARAFLVGYVAGQQIPSLSDVPKVKLYGAAGALIGYFRKELNIIVTPEWANEIVRGFQNGLQS